VSHSELPKAIHPTRTRAGSVKDRISDVLRNALAPLLKPSSGMAIGPDVKKLIDDVGTCGVPEVGHII
jgi:hypothetical protein